MDWSGSDRDLIKQIHEKYTEKLIGERSDCRDCRDSAYVYLKNRKNLTLSAPVGIWHVGDLFKDETYKVVFVGKTAIGGKEIEFDKDSCFGKNILLKKGEEWEDNLSNRISPFWGYIRNILNLLYPDLTEDERVKGVAVTNLLKCNIFKKDGSDFKDYSTKDMIETCLNKMHIFEAEINILKPKKIIFMTGDSYDEFIDNFKFWFDNNGKDVERDEKKMLWWVKEFHNNEGNQLKILRTSHPYHVHFKGQKKEEFVNQIVKWIMEKG